MSIENYKITLFRPEGVSVAQMDAYIKQAVLASVFTTICSFEMLALRDHPVKVVRDHDCENRKEAIF